MSQQCWLFKLSGTTIRNRIFSKIWLISFVLPVLKWICSFQQQICPPSVLVQTQSRFWIFWCPDFGLVPDFSLDRIWTKIRFHFWNWKLQKLKIEFEKFSKNRKIEKIPAIWKNGKVGKILKIKNERFSKFSIFWSSKFQIQIFQNFWTFRIFEFFWICEFYLQFFKLSISKLKSECCPDPVQARIWFWSGPDKIQISVWTWKNPDSGRNLD